MTKKAVIIGGGAAGIFCAANLVHDKLEVVLIEKTNKLLSKVKISGGGRCNVTNGNFDRPKEFARQYPRGERFLRRTLYQFGYEDTIKWFESRGVPLKQEADGRVFPQSNSSQTIIDALLNECRHHKITIIKGCPVQSIHALTSAYQINYKGDQSIIADFVVIATGGFPKLSQYDWLKPLGLKIAPPVPSLFTCNIPNHNITQLMGVSVTNASVRIINSKLNSDGPLLITHWGLSGPAILKLSAIGAVLLAERNYNYSIAISWLPEYNEEELRTLVFSQKSKQAKKKLIGKNPFQLPRRLWEFMIEESGIDPDLEWHELNKKNINRIVNMLCNYTLEVKGKTTFKEEFVTAGGIELEELNIKNLQLKKHPNSYAIGEVTNIDGITGGYNFQNAWTSAYIVAQNIIQQLNVDE